MAGPVPIGRSASWRARCPECRSPLECTGSQLVFRDELQWNIERRCEPCGSQSHACGPGRAPDELRRALLSEHGPATLTIAGEPAGPLLTLKAVRDHLGVPLSEVTATAARLRSRGIDGTFVELEFLATRFRDAGLRVDVLGG